MPDSSLDEIRRVEVKKVLGLMMDGLCKITLSTNYTHCHSLEYSSFDE